MTRDQHFQAFTLLVAGLGALIVWSLLWVEKPEPRPAPKIELRPGEDVGPPPTPEERFDAEGGRGLALTGRTPTDTHRPAIVSGPFPARLPSVAPRE